MPRMVAPPPSGEFSIHLSQPFEGNTTFKIEIIGEPNRPATVRRTNYEGNGKSTEKSGDVPADDVNELMNVVSVVRGFPSDPSKDIFGLDTQLDFSTMEVQWTNKESESTAAKDTSDLADEQKEDFKNVVDSIQALARTFAKQDSAI